MRFFLLGANYKTAPLEIREKMALTKRELGEMTQFLLTDERLSEVVVLTTCNRTEFYLLLDDVQAQELIWDWLSERTGRSKKSLLDFVYIYQDMYVVDHLFQVVCGLDSMVLGEEQILGQVREAYLLSNEQGGVSTFFHLLFSEALRIGKTVRTQTGLAQCGASIPQAAVALVKQIFPDLSSIRAMVLGAGQMGNMALEALYQEGVTDLVVVNRNEEKRNELADRFGGTPISWEDKQLALHQVDLVISSTSAPHYVVTVDELHSLQREATNPLVLIDIAVPRDVEPEVQQLSNVQVYNIDALQQVAMDKLTEFEVQSVSKLIHREKEVFTQKMQVRKVEPVIRALREKAEAIRLQELEKRQTQLVALGEEGQALVYDLTHKILAKLLHDPTIQMKQIASDQEADSLLKMVCQLHNLQLPKERLVK